MPPTPVEFDPRAAAADEVRAALRWYARRQEAVADRFQAEFDRVVGLRRFPYQVIFDETAHAVRVIAVAHTRRRPGYWKSRAIRPL